MLTRLYEKLNQMHDLSVYEQRGHARRPKKKQLQRSSPLDRVELSSTFCNGLHSSFRYINAKLVNANANESQDELQAKPVRRKFAATCQLLHKT